MPNVCLFIATVPAEWRLQLLDKQEAVRFDRFGYALDNMKHLRAVAWHSKTSKRSHYHAWADFTREATKDREQRKRVCASQYTHCIVYVYSIRASNTIALNMLR
jgi:hypothetical protein